ncbi:GerW family sporulation protein [Ornithinibacillus sp. 179-J 7C1 HS]|uniref:GerW family sporulation protein n=1 Tax=Ornithinibacillus sp. 179-J 7C1 HS TaxID=3142384 RepID=UPI0039A2AE61
MEEHPIQGLMTTAMENLKDMVEVNTIIGDPIESPDGSVIIPVSKVGFGFAAGGSEFVPSDSGSGGDSDSSSEAVFPFGGGSGGGVSITPVAFLIVSQKGIKMVHLDQNTHIYEKIIDFAPKAVEKIQQLLKESSQGKGKGSKEKDNQGKSSENEKKEDQPDPKKKSDEEEKNNSEESSSIYDI